ncbi:MAG: DUF3500 domain-containing protein [Chitinophagales bacterium]
MPKKLVLLIILGFCYQFIFSQDNIAEITKSVETFIDSLTPLQKRSALYEFSDTARIKWNNLPVGLRARAGISIGNLSNDQRKLLHRILAASLSSQGYLKATSIMHLDNLINAFYDTLYQRKEFNDTVYQFIKDLKWSHKNYFFAIFGDPSKDSVWSFKLEGHHLSLNFAFLYKKLTVTPMFVGTDPAEYPMGEYAGWRVLGMEEDFGMKLLNSLSPAQKQKAVLSKEAPEDIITGAESGKRLVDYWGIKGVALSKKQQEILLKIVREFVFNLEYDKAMVEYAKILKAGIENIYFGWIGEAEEMKPHYYILNGPTFIIEFDDNGGPRRTANHIHSIWREKGNEFGEDILKKHYASEHQK